MGATKTEHFTAEQNAIAILAKALGHPARVAIVEYLMKVNECICGDIVNELPLAQPTVSQHLKELKNAGLIKGNVEGNAICYCLDEKAIENLQNYFAGISEKLKSKMIVVKGERFMENAENLKEIVREKYGEIALQDKETNQSSCCGAGACSTEVYNIMSDDYSRLEGYNADADLGLGCGLPTEFARIKAGDTVIDLGSGAGNDCFVARAAAGEKGKIIGIDFTPAMIEKARANAERLGYNNIEFRQGDIEKIPVSANVADVVVSNCVLNLVPDKNAVFREIHRVLKDGGHFSISDVVLVGELPEALQKDAEMYAGCVAGAVQKETYLDLIKANCFGGIIVQKEKPITIPNDILSKYLNEEELSDFQAGKHGIFSITVYAEKSEDCCE